MSERGRLGADLGLEDDEEQVERQPWGDPDADEPSGEDESAEERSADTERTGNAHGGADDDR